MCAFPSLCLAMRKMQAKKYIEVWVFQPVKVFRLAHTPSVGEAVSTQAASGIAGGRCKLVEPYRGTLEMPIKISTV